MYNSDAHKFTQCKELPKFDYSAFVDCGGKRYKCLSGGGVLFEWQRRFLILVAEAFSRLA